MTELDFERVKLGGSGYFFNSNSGIVIVEEVVRDIFETEEPYARIGKCAMAVVKDEEGKHLFETTAERWNLFVAEDIETMPECKNEPPYFELYEAVDGLELETHGTFYMAQMFFQQWVKAGKPDLND